MTVYTPDIGGLLPVYVRDRYSGFEVKEFPELTDAELGDYIERNVAAVRDVLAQRRRPGRSACEPPRDGAGDPARAPGSRSRSRCTARTSRTRSCPNLERFGPYALRGARRRPRDPRRLRPHRRAPAPGGGRAATVNAKVRARARPASTPSCSPRSPGGRRPSAYAPWRRTSPPTPAPTATRPARARGTATRPRRRPRSSGSPRPRAPAWSSSAS